MHAESVICPQLTNHMLTVSSRCFYWQPQFVFQFLNKRKSRNSVKIYLYRSQHEDWSTCFFQKIVCYFSLWFGDRYLKQLNIAEIHWKLYYMSKLQVGKLAQRTHNYTGVCRRGIVIAKCYDNLQIHKHVVAPSLQLF